MLYTHNWGLFVDRRRALRARARAGWRRTTGARSCATPCSASAAPSCSTCPGCRRCSTRSSTRARPWLNPPHFGAPVQISKSLLGGGTPTVALLLAAGSGLAADPASRASTNASARRCSRGDRGRASPRSRSPGSCRRSRRPGPPATSACRSARCSCSPRSASPARATRARRARRSSSASGRSRRPSTSTNKSNAADLREAAVPELRPGDLVVSMQPEQTPLVDYHLGSSAERPTCVRHPARPGGERARHGLDRRPGEARSGHARQEPRPAACYAARRRAGPARAPGHHADRRLGRALDRARPQALGPVGRTRSPRTSASSGSRSCRRSTAAPPASGYAECFTRRPR